LPFFTSPSATWRQQVTLSRLFLKDNITYVWFQVRNSKNWICRSKIDFIARIDSNLKLLVCLVMFGYAVRKIDFDKIDIVKLILIKIDFKIKWFMFGYIDAKVSWTKSLSIKINSRIKSYDFYQNQFYFWETKRVKRNSTPQESILAPLGLKPNIHLLSLEVIFNALLGKFIHYPSIFTEF
jgi:hypothetical protein